MGFVFIQGAGGGGKRLDPLSNPATSSDILLGKEAYNENGTKLMGTYDITAHQPQLQAPTISRNGTTINITNPSSNGVYVSGYKVYVDGELVSTQSSTTYSLASLGVGTHTIYVKAYGSNFNDSANSNTVSYAIYSITNNLTDLTTSNAATQIAQDNAYSATLTPAYGLYLPDSITVTVDGNAATFTYDSSTGAISILAANITGNIVITAVAKIYGKLATPVISLSDSTISWSAVVNATDYDIYYEGAVVASTQNTSYDLSTLFTSEGSYKVSVVARATNYTDSDASNQVTYNVGIVASPIYGVSGMYDSATTLTRTDDAVGMSAVVNSSTGTVSSDFDSVFPWNEATVETVGGNKFLKMPEMWFRVGKDANNRITDIAVSKTEGTTGNWYHVDSFYYGCYGGSNNSSKLASVSGVTRLYSQTRATFRTYATANGSGYQQLDLYHRTVMVFLWLIEWANKNSQSIMRGVDNGTQRNTGGTDALTTPSGFNTSTQQMRYHYIEDFVGNYFEFVDGSVGTGSSGGAQYVSATPSAYNDTGTGFNTLSWNSPTTSGDCLAALGWDDNNPFLCLPKETVNNSGYNTYFCDYASTSNNIVLCCGADWSNSAAYYGVLYFYRNAASNALINIGGRLLYKP